MRVNAATTHDMQMDVRASPVCINGDGIDDETFANRRPDHLDRFVAFGRVFVGGPNQGARVCITPVPNGRKEVVRGHLCFVPRVAGAENEQKSGSEEQRRVESFGPRHGFEFPSR